jgi:small GTP-binding protein
MTILAKMCLLGDGNVGKTSLRNQYMGKGFHSDYLPTLGADFASFEVPLPFPTGERSIRWQIWDLAGQPAFNQIRNFYYKHSKAALLVFDLTNSSSLTNLQKWMDEIVQNVGTPKVYINIVGNKSDLKDEDSVTAAEARAFISEKILPVYQDITGPIYYYETSAKTGENVKDAFISLGKSVLQSMED